MVVFLLPEGKDVDCFQKNNPVLFGKFSETLRRLGYARVLGP